jgi:HlyD family secretion protein
MRSLFWWLVVLGTLAGAAGSAVAFRDRLSSWAPWRSATKFRTAVVSRGRVETVVNSTGTIKPVRSVIVGAFVSGPIEKVFVDYNSVVKKGDLLARIDPRLLTATVERDRATLATQKAELARIDALLQQSKNNEERARKLLAVNKDYLSDVEMDQYYYTRLSQEAQLNLAKASISQAEANLKNSVQNLEYTNIVSPVDGIVIECKVDPGQTVAASFQTPELFVVAPEMEKHMHVFASVDEADIGLIRGAQQKDLAVKFTVDAYPEELFEGKIYQIRKNSTTTQNVVTYPVVVVAPNPDLKLLPGMTANLSFQIEAKEDVLRVPTAALRFFPLPAQIHPEDRHYLEGVPSAEADGAARLSAGEKAAAARNRQKRLVWVREGDLLRAVPVTLGLSDNQQAELLEGNLSEGQAVVVGAESAFGPAGR